MLFKIYTIAQREYRAEADIILKRIEECRAIGWTYGPSRYPEKPLRRLMHLKNIARYVSMLGKHSIMLLVAAKWSVIFS